MVKIIHFRLGFSHLKKKQTQSITWGPPWKPPVVPLHQRCSSPRYNGSPRPSGRNAASLRTLPTGFVDWRKMWGAKNITLKSLNERGDKKTVLSV